MHLSFDFCDAEKEGCLSAISGGIAGDLMHFLRPNRLNSCTESRSTPTPLFQAPRARIAGGQKMCLMPIIAPSWLFPGAGLDPGAPLLTESASWPPLSIKPAVAYTDVRLENVYVPRKA